MTLIAEPLWPWNRQNKKRAARHWLGSVHLVPVFWNWTCKSQPSFSPNNKHATGFVNKGTGCLSAGRAGPVIHVNGRFMPLPLWQDPSTGKGGVPLQKLRQPPHRSNGWPKTNKNASKAAEHCLMSITWQSRNHVTLTPPLWPADPPP